MRTHTGSEGTSCYLPTDEVERLRGALDQALRRERQALADRDAARIERDEAAAGKRT